MIRLAGSSLLGIVWLWVAGSAGMQARAQPTEPERQDLPALVSLRDREVVYGGVDRPRARSPIGEVFGWRDGSIRLAATIDTAGDCATAFDIAAVLVGRMVRVTLRNEASGDVGILACPAVFTPQIFYARVSGLAPGVYELQVRAPRWVSVPVPADGIRVPNPEESRPY